MQPLSAGNVKRVFKGSICLVGQGRWGSSLAAALRAQGRTVFTADPRKPLTGRNFPVWAGADIFWLCVPDGEIPAAARMVIKCVQKTGGTMNQRTVLHSSGLYGSEILKRASDAGALVASVHPMMSFPTRKPVPLAGVPFAVEADQELKLKLFRLVRLLGGKPFAVRAEGKAFYHAAAVTSSPLLVGLASAAVEMAVLSGVSRKESATLLQPIMTATLASYFQQGSSGSFSGPFARGDAKTVSLHLAALESHPELEQIYKSLARFVIQTMPVKHQKKLRQSLQAVKSSSPPARQRNR